MGGTTALIRRNICSAATSEGNGDQRIDGQRIVSEADSSYNPSAIYVVTVDNAPKSRQ